MYCCDALEQQVVSSVSRIPSVSSRIRTSVGHACHELHSVLRQGWYREAHLESFSDLQRLQRVVQETARWGILQGTSNACTVDSEQA